MTIFLAGQKAGINAGTLSTMLKLFRVMLEARILPTLKIQIQAKGCPN
ncbi:MAG TPA: hypothetical protein VHL11_10450 [Phototrophicaceae bacterium]|jgi:hypothetical protein|nr:hypothetical protein [Phototrophicaceae bacterium]